MASLGRLRPALAELSLAFLGLLVGVAVMLVLGGFGLVPTGEGAQWFGFVGGPAITLMAALFYRWATARLDERADPAESGALRERLHLPRAGVALSVLGLLVGVGVALGGSIVLGWLMEQLGFPVQEQVGITRIVEAAKEGGATFEVAVLSVAAVVLAPLAEEWLFRGLLFRRIRAVGGRPVAYLLSALAFAAIHTNPAGFVIYLWLGLLFAGVYERTGRLWVPIGVHMGNNTFALIGLFFA